MNGCILVGVHYEPDERSRRDWFPEQFSRLHEKLESLQQSLASLHRKVDEVMSQQSELNADVGIIQQFLTDVEAEIATLEAANPAVDFTNMRTLVTAVQAADPGPGATPTP